MDESSVRQQLEEIKRALAKNEEEHEVLVSLLKGFEGWLRIGGFANGSSAQLTLPIQARPSATAPKGRISFRRAVLSVIKDARGEPLHSKEIWLRAQDLGAVTAAKNPEAIVDLMAYSLQKDNVPLEKAAPRTWRWVGEGTKARGDGS